MENKEHVDFVKGDLVFRVGENHLYSTNYNIPSFSKKYCKKVKNS